MSTFMGVAGLVCLVLGVGCIDGGYNGVPMNDNWIGFGLFSVTGILLMFGCLATQESD